MLPADGCPGPVVRDVDSRLRLVALDTQWWLHAYEKPTDPGSSCPEDSEAEVVDALRAAIEGAGERRVVVVGHHPLASRGIHGGTSAGGTTSFPSGPSAPGCGSLSPASGPPIPSRVAAGSATRTCPGPSTSSMREAIGGVFKKVPPLAYAAGHEHNLQVIQRKGAEYLIVSGTGFYGHTSRVAPDENTLYAARASGFVRLDLSPTGEVRLAVVVANAAGNTREAFSKMLK